MRDERFDQKGTSTEMAFSDFGFFYGGYAVFIFFLFNMEILW